MSNPELIDKAIPKEVLQEFLEKKLTLGEIKNINIIVQHQVNNDKFRINVWTSELVESELIPSNKISHSYYLLYENLDDGVVDETKVSYEKEQTV